MSVKMNRIQVLMDFLQVVAKVYQIIRTTHCIQTTPITTTECPLRQQQQQHMKIGRPFHFRRCTRMWLVNSYYIHYLIHRIRKYLPNHILLQIYDANGNPQVIPDINVYQQKKNLAQGMMDLALLSANANQLRYVVETQPRHPYYWFSLVFISVSLILQVRNRFIFIHKFI